MSSTIINSANYINSENDIIGNSKTERDLIFIMYLIAKHQKKSSTKHIHILPLKKFSLENIHPKLIILTRNPIQNQNYIFNLRK